MIRALTLAAIASALLAGCADPPPSPQASADQAAISACRTRADDIYVKQNRAELYQTDTSDSPLSSSGLKGFTSEGLGGLHQRDSMVSSCIRQSTAQPDASPNSVIPGDSGGQP